MSDLPAGRELIERLLVIVERIAVANEQTAASAARSEERNTDTGAALADMLTNQKRMVAQNDENAVRSEQYAVQSEQHRAECEKSHQGWNQLGQSLLQRLEALEARLPPKESWEP